MSDASSKLSSRLALRPLAQLSRLPHAPHRCAGFFSILGDPPWDSAAREKGSCHLFEKYAQQLSLLSATMARFGTNATIFAMHPHEQPPLSTCLQLPNVRIRTLDPNELLTASGFSEREMSSIRSFPSYARLTDILRVALGAQHGMAYHDMDVVYLRDDSAIYLDGPTLAGGVWKDEGAGLEVSNCAFCLSPAQCRLLLRWARVRLRVAEANPLLINRYTEFGPTLFQYALGHLGPLRVQPTNSPIELRDWVKSTAGAACSEMLAKLAKQSERYGSFSYVHLTWKSSHRLLDCSGDGWAPLFRALGAEPPPRPASVPRTLPQPPKPRRAAGVAARERVVTPRQREPPGEMRRMQHHHGNNPTSWTAIPQRLIFTHHRCDLLSDGTEACGSLTHHERIRRAMVRQTVAVNTPAGPDGPKPTIDFYTDKSCSVLLAEVEPRLLPHFRQERSPAYRSDTCRGAALLKTGGPPRPCRRVHVWPQTQTNSEHALPAQR